MKNIWNVEKKYAVVNPVLSMSDFSSDKPDCAPTTLLWSTFELTSATLILLGNMSCDQEKMTLKINEKYHLRWG